MPNIHFISSPKTTSPVIPQTPPHLPLPDLISLFHLPVILPACEEMIPTNLYVCETVYNVILCGRLEHINIPQLFRKSLINNIAEKVRHVIHEIFPLMLRRY